jgi:hypothetical protein
MQQAIQDYFNGLCCPVTTFNFDVTGDWAASNITDQASFENFLTNSSIQNVVITDFNLTGNRLQMNINANASSLDFSGSGITSIKSFGDLGWQNVDLLSLEYNQLTTAAYAEMESWANSLPTAPSGGTISFLNNTNSISGTNLETILTSKGWTVNV